VVTQITLGPNFDLEAGQLIVTYGPPDGVWSQTDGIGRPLWVIDLYYVSRGAEFRLMGRPGDNSMRPTTDVVAVYLFVPTTIGGRVADEFGEYAETMLQGISPWLGFGDLTDVYGKPRLP
jgi:hypothetical protein